MRMSNHDQIRSWLCDARRMGQRAGAFVRACIAAACVAAAAAGVPVRASRDAASRREGEVFNSVMSSLPAIEAEQGGPPTTSVIEVCPISPPVSRR